MIVSYASSRINEFCTDFTVIGLRGRESLKSGWVTIATCISLCRPPHLSTPVFILNKETNSCSLYIHSQKH